MRGRVPLARDPRQSALNPLLEPFLPDDTRPTLITWVSHPARREPARAAFAVVVIAVMVVGVTLWVGPILGLVALLVMLGSVYGFLFAAQYELDERGITIRTIFGSQRREWSTLRRADVGQRGVHLSPFSTRSWLDGPRGIYLRFDGNRDEVMAVIDERIANTRHRDPLAIGRDDESAEPGSNDGPEPLEMHTV